MKTDIIRFRHAGLFVVETVGMFKAWVRDLGGVFADFDFGNNIAVVVFHSAQLVYAAEHRGGA